MDQRQDADVALLLQAGRSEDADPVTGRDLRAQLVLGGGFLAAALAVGFGFEAERAWEADHAVVLTLLFALALRVRFEVGAGYTVAVQLAFVPMLLLLPTPWVPLLVLAAFALERVPDLARSHLHPTRLLLLPANAWFAVGPAVVLSALDAQTPDWSDWPVYVLAFLAQVILDAASGELREWLGRGISPRLQLRAIGVVPLIDGLLSPIGLLAAFASQSFEFAYLLLVPPAGLLVVYSRERARRIRAALDVVETEREAVRSREALVAGASHELLTPMAVVSGLVNRLGGERELDPDRRRMLEGSLRREVAQLRHLTRQFVDYTRLKAGQPVTVRLREVPIEAALADVAAIFSARAEIEVAVDGPPPVARADPDRLQQMLMILLSNAVKHAPGAPVRLTARAAGDHVEIHVADRGPGIAPDLRDTLFDDLRRGEDAAEGAGIGLFLCRALARAQHGDVTETGDGPGATFLITLPPQRA